MGTHPIFESDFDCLTENVKMSTNAKPAQVVKCLELLSTVDRVRRLKQNEEMRSNIIRMIETKSHSRMTANVIELGIIKHGIVALLGNCGFNKTISIESSSRRKCPLIN